MVAVSETTLIPDRPDDTDLSYFNPAYVFLRPTFQDIQRYQYHSISNILYSKTLIHEFIKKKNYI